jgi:hypothetical protein
MQPLRWTGVTVCAVLAVFGLVYAVIDGTKDWAGGFGRNLAVAGLFGVSAVRFGVAPAGGLPPSLSVC